jgi:hypothetical protein
MIEVHVANVSINVDICRASSGFNLLFPAACVAAAAAAAMAATAVAGLLAVPFVLKLLVDGGGWADELTDELAGGAGMFVITGDAPGDNFPPKRLLIISPLNLSKLPHITFKVLQPFLLTKSSYPWALSATPEVSSFTISLSPGGYSKPCSFSTA